MDPCPPTAHRRVPKIRLTKTDLAVLRSIAPDRFRDYEALRAGVLSGVSRSHSWVILKRLVHHRYLTEIRGDGACLLGWSLTPKSKRHKEVKIYLPSYPTRAPVYRSAFDHDLVVREVRAVLSKSPAIRDWITDLELKRTFMHRLLAKRERVSSESTLAIPDGAFNIGGGDTPFRGALEVELARKSKARIYRKLEAHSLSPDFDFAFFVMKDEKLLTLFNEIYDVLCERSPRIKFARKLNGIYFTTLHALREQGLHALFKSRNDELTLADLAA